MDVNHWILPCSVFYISINTLALFCWDTIILHENGLIFPGLVFCGLLGKIITVLSIGLIIPFYQDNTLSNILSSALWTMRFSSVISGFKHYSDSVIPLPLPGYSVPGLRKFLHIHVLVSTQLKIQEKPCKSSGISALWSSLFPITLFYEICPSYSWDFQFHLKPGNYPSSPGFPLSCTTDWNLS